MRILIIGDAFSYPNGYGATTRVHAIARGLKNAGADVKVLITSACEPEHSPMNKNVQGVYQGIPFEYTTGRTTRAPSFWLRRWIQLRSIYRILWISKNQKRKGIDAVLFFTVSSLVLPLIIGPLCKSWGAVLLYDGCEYPFIYHGNTIRDRLFAYLYIHSVYKIYNGIFVISSFLEEEFKQWISPAARIIRIPILVDPDEYLGPDQGSSTVTPKIVYAGNLSHREEIDTLIRAYAVIAGQFRNIKLQIIGDSSESGIITYFKNEALNLNLENRIEFTGMLRRSETIRQISGATILVLFRSRGIFSRAGFPTKLGEYLMTGRPVIVTDNGDIVRYLKTNYNAFLIPPDDNGKLINCLKYVLDHPDEAIKVGNQGKKTAMKYFDYRSHGYRLFKFIKALRNTN